MTLQWAAARMTDGAVLAYLPLQVDWPLRRILSNYSTATAHYNLASVPVNDIGEPVDWQEMLREGGSWFACYDDDDPSEAIQWCGFGVVQTRDTATDVIDIDMATAEAYADRRFVGDATHTTTEGRNTIMAGLIPLLADGSAPGIPITASFDGPGPEPTADLIWQNTDNVSVLGRWNQLIGQLGGEYMIDWHWTTAGDGTRAIAATLHIADRIGTPASPGLAPDVTFYMPGPLQGLRQVRDYSAGKGANSVTAYSSGQGAVTPYAAPVLAPDFQDRPTYEYRYQPAPSVSVPTLTQYADQAITVLAPGARSTTLTISTARQDEGRRRFGTDWGLGDDIGYATGDKDNDGRKILAFPGGISGVGRVLAVDIDDEKRTISPVLAEAEVYVEASF